MKYLTRVLLAPILMATCPVLAEVTDAEAGGFTTVNEVLIDANRIDAWKAAIDDVGQWWNSDHTVAGDARRMSITAVPQGCFCERFESGGGVVHMNVTMVSPGVIIRLTGGLGPLGLMGVEGNMTWEFEDADGGTVVRFTYAVGGYRAGGLEPVAEPVDFVVGEALNRLKAHIESRDSESAGAE